MSGTIARDALLDESSLAFGAPAFDRIEADRFLPALEVGAQEATREIAEIAASLAPPSFENVVVALERSGARLARARRIFWTLGSAQSSDAIRAIEPLVSTLLTRHSTEISHNPQLFARVAAVWAQRDTLPLDEAQRRLLDNSHRGFVDGGAALDSAAKARFAEIDLRLSELGTAFGQNVLVAAAEWEMWLDEADLDGLPDPVRTAAARRAEARGQPGRFLVTLDRGDVEALLTFSNRRNLRETMWRAFTGRNDGGAHDNRPLIDEMLALRREKAALLGYSTYADYALTDTMARTPQAAQDLLMRVWRPAVKQAAAEQQELQTLARQDDPDFVLQPWDWRFFAERVRRERFALDGGEARAHLTLDRVLAAAFATAGKLYGVAFARCADLPGWHCDVEAWAVTDRDGAKLGLLYTDYFARSEKHGGAWMGSLRVQEKLDEPVLPIVYLVANFAKSPDSGTSGLAIDEARTLFHEFGHALHALLSDVTYPSQAGTAVTRDFVEFPSKFMEHWIIAPETLSDLGLPPPLIEAIGHVDDFGQGFSTVEFLASAILDMALHRTTDTAPHSARIAASTLADIGMPATIAPRHGLTHFTHIFDGGYAASYYAYLWSEVLDADAFEAFEEKGDLFDPVLAERFRREILARGNTRDPLASFIAFRGREPREDALLRDRRLA